MNKLFALLTAAYLLSACSETIYEAQQNFGGTVIRAKMIHNHPFIAEYKRSVQINNKKEIDFGQDSGGYPFINVFETPTTIILEAFYVGLLTINRKDQSVTHTERPLNKNEEQYFVGKFNFIKKHEKREYLFIPSTIDPKFDPQVIKG